MTPPALASGTTATGTAEAEFQQIRTLLDNRDYAAADSSLRAFIAAHPAHPLASSAFFWLGEIYYDRADYQRAAETYAAGYANYPTGYKAADTLLKLGMTLRRLGQNQEACATFGELDRRFPDANPRLRERAGQERQAAGCT